MGALAHKPAAVVLDNGTIRFTQSLDGVLRGFTLQGSGGTFEIDSDKTIVLVTKASNDFDNLTGAGGLTKTGAGTLILSTSKVTYTGATVVENGRLVTGASNTINNTASYTVNENGTLEFNITESNNKSLNISLSGTGKVVKSGTGTLNYNNAGIGYTGPTEVNEGTLNLLIANSMVNSSNVSIALGATIQSAAAQTIKHLSGEGSVSMAGQTLTLYNDEGEDNATIFSGSITANQLIKNGGGTLRLNQEQNAATLTADVLVQAGRLDLKGNLTGDLTVMNGAIFSPGNSIGEATVLDAIFEEGSILLVEMDETGNDVLTFGTVDFGEGGNISLFDLGGATVPDNSFVFLKTDSTLPSDLNSLLTPASRALWNLSIDEGTGGIRATIDNNAIPEPASWMLLLFGSLGMLSLYRKRK